MTDAQFDVLVKLMRGNKASPANRAARRVLVESIAESIAGREVGAARQTVHTTVERYERAHQLVLAAYSPG